MTSSGATGSAAREKRGHIPTTGNPLFMMPTKPQSKKNKRNEIEPKMALTLLKMLNRSFLLKDKDKDKDKECLI